jgi:hypothetical protein
MPRCFAQASHFGASAFAFSLAQRDRVPKFSTFVSDLKAKRPHSGGLIVALLHQWLETFSGEPNPFD